MCVGTGQEAGAVPPLKGNCAQWRGAGGSGVGVKVKVAGEIPGVRLKAAEGDPAPLSGPSHR